MGGHHQTVHQNVTAPESYPTAMCHEELKLKSVSMVPPGIKYLYLRNNQIDHIDEKAFET